MVVRSPNLLRTQRYVENWYITRSKVKADKLSVYIAKVTTLLRDSSTGNLLTTVNIVLNWKVRDVSSDLEDDEKNEEEKHVDNVEDDGLLDSNAKEQSRTDEEPVLDEHVPQPATCQHTHRHTHNAGFCRGYVYVINSASVTTREWICIRQIKQYNVIISTSVTIREWICIRQIEQYDVINSASVTTREWICIR